MSSLPIAGAWLPPRLRPGGVGPVCPRPPPLGPAGTTASPPIDGAAPGWSEEQLRGGAQREEGVRSHGGGGGHVPGQPQDVRPLPPAPLPSARPHGSKVPSQAPTHQNLLFNLIFTPFRGHSNFLRGYIRNPFYNTVNTYFWPFPGFLTVMGLRGEFQLEVHFQFRNNTGYPHC